MNTSRRPDPTHIEQTESNTVHRSKIAQLSGSPHLHPVGMTRRFASHHHLGSLPEIRQRRLLRWKHLPPHPYLVEQPANKHPPSRVPRRPPTDFPHESLRSLAVLCPLDEPKTFGDERPSAPVHSEPPVGEGAGIGVGIDQTLRGESSKQWVLSGQWHDALRLTMVLAHHRWLRGRRSHDPSCPDSWFMFVSP